MDRTTIPVPDLCHLIELCLKSTYFLFSYLFYEHVEGAAMGSPLSPVVAILYMEAFEKQILEAALRRPIFWVGYTNDVFSIWPHDTQFLDEFLGHLNTQKAAIQFTMEKEEDGKIAFLEVLVEKKGTPATTSIFRKKTPTDRYMNYDSHHHARIKTSIIKRLGTRAKNVCHATKLIGERNHLKQVFQANGYPAQMVNRTLRNRPHAPHSSTQTAEQTTTPKFLHLPYVRGVSERTERKCRRLGIRTAFKSKGSLGANKRPPMSGRRKESCTIRRMRECLHWRNRKNTGEEDKWTQRSSEETLCEEWHRSTFITKQHKVDWQAATVKHVETNHSKRKTIEGLRIHLQRETSNFDCRRTLSPVWHLLLWNPPPPPQARPPKHIHLLHSDIMHEYLNPFYVIHHPLSYLPLKLTFPFTSKTTFPFISKTYISQIIRTVSTDFKFHHTKQQMPRVSMCG